MRRRSTTHGQADAGRWMVSYADFITLMFAMFVVLFASSQRDRARVWQISDSVRRALGSSSGIPLAAGASDLTASLRLLEVQLAPEISAGKLQVKLEPRGLVVSLTEAAFFPSGEDTIAPASYASIEKIAAALRGLPNPVRLEGHTDSLPIRNERFRSNWELSAARAVAMLELLRSRYGIPERRLTVAGYAANSPVGPNDTEQGRARNRRVDIVILSRTGTGLQP